MTPKERAKEATESAGLEQWGSDDQEQLELAVEQAIIAAIEESRPTWQPINTAPKDGTWILLRGRNSVDRPMIPVVAAWRYERYSYSWYDSGSLKNLHDLASTIGADWMPLP